MTAQRRSASTLLMRPTRHMCSVWPDARVRLQGKGYGYAAIHGCTGDTVKFVWGDNEVHNLVEIATQAQGAPTCCQADDFLLKYRPYLCPTHTPSLQA